MNIQQLRAKIAALQDATMDENKNFRTAYDEGKFDALSAVDALLDSLQEEPKFKIGDIIRFKGNETLEGEEKTHKIVGYDNELYIFDDGTTDLFCEQELYELVKEPVSEDLEEAVDEYAHDLLHDDVFETFIAGAQWQKEHLWKPADGDDLPEIDKEVIVLYQRYPLENNEYAVGFAHRPNSDGWDGKNLLTDEIEHYTPETYDKGGWNIPDVKFWLDCDLPKNN